jgi:hypothetical protein
MEFLDKLWSYEHNIGYLPLVGGKITNDELGNMCKEAVVHNSTSILPFQKLPGATQERKPFVSENEAGMLIPYHDFRCVFVCVHACTLPSQEMSLIHSTMHESTRVVVVVVVVELSCLHHRFRSTSYVP